MPTVEDFGGWRLYQVIIGDLTPQESKAIESKLSGKWNSSTVDFVGRDGREYHWVDTDVYCHAVLKDREGKALVVNPLFAGNTGVVLSEGEWNVEPPNPWYFVVIDGWGIGVDERNLEMVPTAPKSDENKWRRYVPVFGLAVKPYSPDL